MRFTRFGSFQGAVAVTAFLFLRTLVNAARIDPGFQTANIELASLDVSLSGFRGQAAVTLVERIRERVAGRSTSLRQSVSVDS